jgi:hypothetical protein
MHRELLQPHRGPRNRPLIWNCVLLVLLFCGIAPVVSGQDDGLKSVPAGFKDVPADCRIIVRWWWFGPSVTKPELERELRAMKEGGIGGVEVQPVYPQALDDPEHGFHNFPYLSDEFIEDLRFAAGKAHELGLRIDLTLGSGWPFGGPHIPIQQAAGKLRVVSVSISPEVRSIPVPSIEAGENILAAFVTSGEAKSGAKTAALDLSEIRNGRLYLPDGRAPAGGVLWFIASRTGMMVKRAAVGAEGFVLDHFDRAAIENHLSTVGDRLMQAFGNGAPYAVFSDSLEVYDSDWTGDLLQEFRQRRGYDLTPYLPALVQDIGPKTSDIRRDWGRTLTELIDEHYLTPVREWAAQHKTRFRSQTYGIPAVTLANNALVDLRGAFSRHTLPRTSSIWGRIGASLFLVLVEVFTWISCTRGRMKKRRDFIQARLFTKKHLASRRRC